MILDHRVVALDVEGSLGGILVMESKLSIGSVCVIVFDALGGALMWLDDVLKNHWEEELPKQRFSVSL